MKRGEIWLVNLDPTIGAEIRKIRPAIILNNDELGVLPIKVVIPITEWKEKFKVAPWMVQILPNIKNGLTKISSADCLQIRGIAKERFINKIGIVEVNILNNIELAVYLILDLKV